MEYTKYHEYKHEAPRTYFLWLLVLILMVFSVLPMAVGAQSATLSLSPSTGSFGIGDEFSVMVRVHTGGTSMNATEATINFPAEFLTVTSLSKSGSVFSLWTVEPTFSGSGIVTFAGGTPVTFSGSAGTLVTINFKAKKEGEAQVTFSSARILAADGQGTNIFGGASGASYEISTGAERARLTPKLETPVTAPSRPPAKPKIISPTHPDEEAWYSNTNPEFSWVLPKDATAVSFLLDRIPERDPEYRPKGLLDYKLYSDVEDGVKYFHLKVKNAYGWSQIAHYRVQIDSEPPRPFEIEVLDGRETTDPAPVIFFQTEDKLSGIGYYEVETDGGEKAKTERLGSNPFKLPRQLPGAHAITVKAYDKAGNFIEDSETIVIDAIAAPKTSSFNKELFIGEKLEAQGSGIPRAKIDLYIKKDGAKEERRVAAATVNENGEWSLARDSFLVSGNYSFYLVQEDERGARSNASETFKFTVQAFVKIGPLRLSSFSIALILGLLFGSSAISIYFLLRKIRSILRRVRREAKDAEQKLHKSVDRVKEELIGKLRDLDTKKGAQGLPEEEVALEKKLKKDLDSMEKFMRKEIEDITRETKSYRDTSKKGRLAELVRRVKNLGRPR